MMNHCLSGAVCTQFDSWPLGRLGAKVHIDRTIGVLHDALIGRCKGYAVAIWPSKRPVRWRLHAIGSAVIKLAGGAGT